MKRLATILTLLLAVSVACLANVQPRPRWFVLFSWEWFFNFIFSLRP
jgi:hypothetical protein